MNYTEALEYIHGINARGSKLGLTRVTELLRLMGNPQDGLKFVHVAGTNGKGSTCSMLSHIFCEAGYQTGLFVSPYINRFNERIQLNNTPIADDELAALTTYAKALSETMPDPPTEFETITAMAMEFYKRKGCEIVVLEVGLGGELDSTNIISTPELAIITAIDHDHNHILGDTIAEIAQAKAGIIKQAGDVLIYEQKPEALKVIEAACAKTGSRLHKPDFAQIRSLDYSLDNQHFEYPPYGSFKLSLLGEYQMYNAALVITAVDILRTKGFEISDTALRGGLAKAKWPGRFEVLSRKPVFIVDGGHNVHGIGGTLRSLLRLFPQQKIKFVLGLMADKDVSHIIDMLYPCASEFITVTPDNPRAMDSHELAAELKRLGGRATAYDTVQQGIEAALQSAGNLDVICAIGSLYMAGEVRAMFKLS